MKLEQQKLDYLKADKEKAVRVEASLGTTETRIGEARDKVKSLDLQIEAVNAAINRLTDDLHSLNSLLSELDRLQHDLNMTTQTKSDLGSNLRFMDGKNTKNDFKYVF